MSRWKPIPLEDRFRSYVAVTPSGCHEWMGAKRADGYGVIRINGVTRRAHRVAWEMANGPIPEGLFACHKCDNRCCCNPEHLFLGTPRDNIADMCSKGRGVWPEKTHCLRGHIFDAENTYLYQGRRHCRTCRRDSTTKARQLAIKNTVNKGERKCCHSV